MMAYLMLVLLLVNSIHAKNNSFEECATKRSTLLTALFETENNLNQLDEVFYPNDQLPSRFIVVNYHFQDSDGMLTDNCSVSYFWASGGFLLIQPPKIFLFTSLFFSYPENDLTGVDLVLPFECRPLVEKEGRCSCNSPILDRLTQQVCIIIL